MKEKDRSCPRKQFREDLVRQLKKWRDSGERLVVCMDANKDIYSKSIGKALTDPEGLGMAEVVGEFTGKKWEPPTIAERNQLMVFGQHRTSRLSVHA